MMLMLMLMRMMMMRMMASKTYDVQFYVGIPVQGHHKPHNRSVRFSEPKSEKERERLRESGIRRTCVRNKSQKKKKVTDKTGLIV